jgi:peroxiredoxin
MRLIGVVLIILAVQPALRAGEPLKDFTLPSARDGSLIRLADYSGKVVLINWWRTDCGRSQRESPNLVALYQKHRDQGLVILGVSDDTAPTVAEIPAYLKRHSIAWPIGLNDQGEFMREVRSRGQGETPGNYLVSRSGELTYLGLDRSSASWQKIEETVSRALAEAAPTTRAIKPQELSPAPAFSLPDVQGKAVKRASFDGKPLVVNFFNAGSCDWAGAVLSKLHQDFAGRGLQVVGINLFDQDAQIQGCIGKHGGKYPVLRGDEATQRAWIGESKGWATFFVTPDGKILKKIVDSIDNGLEAQVFAKYAEYLLAKR